MSNDRQATYTVTLANDEQIDVIIDFYANLDDVEDKYITGWCHAPDEPDDADTRNAVTAFINANEESILNELCGDICDRLASDAAWNRSMREEERRDMQRLGS